MIGIAGIPTIKRFDRIFLKQNRITHVSRQRSNSNGSLFLTLIWRSKISDSSPVQNLTWSEDNQDIEVHQVCQSAPVWAGCFPPMIWLNYNFFLTLLFWPERYVCIAWPCSIQGMCVEIFWLKIFLYLNLNDKYRLHLVCLRCISWLFPWLCSWLDSRLCSSRKIFMTFFWLKVLFAWKKCCFLLNGKTIWLWSGWRMFSDEDDSANVSWLVSDWRVFSGCDLRNFFSRRWSWWKMYAFLRLNEKCCLLWSDCKISSDLNLTVQNLLIRSVCDWKASNQFLSICDSES